MFKIFKRMFKRESNVKNEEQKKRRYVFDSVFPNEEIADEVIKILNESKEIRK